LGPAQIIDGSGQATITIGTLSVGSHSIWASYSGSADGSFNGSTAAALTQTVNQAATKTTVTSSASTPHVNQQVTFTAAVAAVAPGVGTPTGTVTFFINGSQQAPVALTMINGVDYAVFTYTFTNAGTYTITASYSGDANFATSTSSPYRQKITV
jgi:hypothetical protein